MQNIIIPEPMQIVMDDVGWFCGRDKRTIMEPARTGITRRHCATDYETINEIGRRLNMKINCAFVMAEWDPDNRLKNIPGLSVYGENWDNASFFNESEAEKCVRVINDSDYIDIAIHGLHHSYYVKGQAYNNTDYYMKGIPVAEDEIRKRLDAYFDLMHYHRFKKNINSFVPPGFIYKENHLSKILKDYDVLYISTILSDIIDGKNETDAYIENGIIVVDRKNNLIPWEEMESNLDALPVSGGVFGCHWANICHKNPEYNYKLIDGWVNYFEKCKKTFGIILSEDMSFCANQTVYKKYAKISCNDECYTIDLNNMPDADGLGNCFYISTKEPISKRSGCKVEIKEKHQEFINYKITPENKIITLV